MSDQCATCQYRGVIDLCLSVECNHHESWYAGHLQAQLAERDKTILDQQIIIKNLANALDAYFTTDDFNQEVKEACAGLEAALKAERIKTLEDAAERLYGEYHDGIDHIVTSVLRMANELKEKQT